MCFLRCVHQLHWYAGKDGGSSGGAKEYEGAAPLQGRQFQAANVFLLHQEARPYVFGPRRQYPLLRHWEGGRERRGDEREKEGTVLFNDALNTFYLRLYGVRHMVEDHSDSERGNPAAATWATLFN